MSLVRTLYVQRLLEAHEDMEEAERGIREFSHSLAVEKLLDCYFSIVRFDLEFKTDYSADLNEADPYQLLALHIMLVKKQFDIDNMLTMVNRNTVQSQMSVLKRLFTDNRAFGEVVSILNKVTDLRLPSKTHGTTTVQQQSSPSLPTGLSHFDMSVAGGFDTVIGQDRAIAKIKALVEESVTVFQPLSIILYGPPGTGKTSIALAIGREYKLNVYTIAVASLGGHYVGEREKNTVEIFKYLENLDEENVLLFVDEADSFLTTPTTNDTQQAQYTRAVTTESFERYLKPKKNRNGDKTRVLLMATNFLYRVSDDIRNRSVTILIDLPRSQDDMKRLVDFYRKANRINMTERRLERIVAYALEMELAPSHLSHIMRRIATQVLLDMIKRGVVVRKYTERSMPNAYDLLALPLFTVGGTSINRKPDTSDTVVQMFNAKHERHEKKNRLKLLSGEERPADMPATAVYPFYDGEVERFFRSFDNFDRLLTTDDGSKKDPDYVPPDDDDDDRGERDDAEKEYSELKRASLVTSRTKRTAADPVNYNPIRTTPRTDTSTVTSTTLTEMPTSDKSQPISLSTGNYTYVPPTGSPNAGHTRLDMKSKRSVRLDRYAAERATLYPRRDEIKSLRSDDMSE